MHMCMYSELWILSSFLIDIVDTKLNSPSGEYGITAQLY